MPQSGEYLYSVQPSVEDDTDDAQEPWDNRGEKKSLHYWPQSLLIVFSVLGGMLLAFVIQFLGGRGLQIGSDAHGVVPKFDGGPLPRIMDHHAAHYVSAATFESPANLNSTIQAWNKLGPRTSSGSSEPPAGAFVKIFEEEISEYLSPINFSTPSGPLYAIQVTGIHQVHCLTTLLRDYSLLLMGYTWDELYDDLTIEEMRGHMAHCFNTILLGLTCLADGATTGGIRGSMAADYEHTTHVCNDYDALLDWAMDEARII